MRESAYKVTQKSIHNICFEFDGEGLGVPRHCLCTQGVLERSKRVLERAAPFRTPKQEVAAHGAESYGWGPMGPGPHVGPMG